MIGKGLGINGNLFWVAMNINNLVNKIYGNLPVPIQNFGISIFGLYWFNRRFGGVFSKQLKSCMDREYFSYSEWNNYQTYLLRKLLIHSFDTVPYYKDLFIRLGIEKYDLSRFSIEDLRKIPFLNKEIYRKQGVSDLLSDSLEPSGEFYSSSGSTGTPTKTRYSLRMHQTYFSIFESRINYWANIDYKTPRGVIGGRRILKEGNAKGPYYRYNFIEKQTYFSAYHISPSTVKNYVEGMFKHKVEYMTGYASANFHLAKMIEEKGIEAPRLKAVLTSSEPLTNEMRETFFRVYGCKTFDSYNGVEACNLISECEFGTLHIVPDVGIVEIINDEGEPVLPGETGEIISTGLLNFDQPLIRYRMGDLVTLSKNQNCACGRNMIVVDEIVGRIEDTVVGLDGRRINRFHGIFVDIMSIKEAQVVQNSLTDFSINIVSEGELSVDEVSLIEMRMQSQLGPVTIGLNYMNEIPRTKNGKFKSVISLLNS
ncbi:phenylacetate--CoA ligase family protein [Algoriphagus sp.]|uniref:phenylacetate--CoA ligase family protein n=1 Tax=Algoriphagus sp. TaxID=1872435 RepID=UPI0027168363|nr:hypothetical protein [Algoriphagus sp.]MDO8967471.1 hypothetical protein [Algoriphagus sp.]MDP3201781.1 hypothetical protein [Algoriphagus sp.]